MDNFDVQIENRVQNEKVKGLFVAKTLLSNLSMITYSVPKGRLEEMVPKELELLTFGDGDKKCALINVVAYKSGKFRFKNIFPFINFDYGQVNYRTFVKNERGEWSVFFLNNGVGTSIYRIPKWLWKLPWYKAKFNYSKANNDYLLSTTYKGEKDVDIDMNMSEEVISKLEGFKSLDEMKLIMTHAYKGYYTRNSGGLAEYAIWHKRFKMYKANPRQLHFRYLLESKLLNQNEMNKPIACWTSDNIEYTCQFPPKRV